MEEERNEQLDKLFEQGKKYVKPTLYKVFPRPKLSAKQFRLDVEDLMQYGYTGLWKACMTFDESKGVKFRTHAINHIRWHILERTKRECHFMKMEANKPINPEDLPPLLSFDCPMDHGKGMEPTYPHDIIASDMLKVEDMVWDDMLIYDIFGDTLTDKDKTILSMRFQEVELKEIGKVFGQSGEYMGHRLKKLKPKMKRYLEVV